MGALLIYLAVEQGRIMYAVLGCGRLGCEVVRSLDSCKENLVIFDDDEGSLGMLEEQGFRVIPVTELSPAIVEEHGEEWSRVYLLGDDGTINVELARAVRKLLPEATIIVNSADKESEKALNAVDGIILFRATDVARDALSSTMASLERQGTALRLRSILEKAGGTVAIFTHDNPDPDSLASAMAFSAICKHLGIPLKIYHGGEISHQENLEMVRLLDLELFQLTGGDDLAIALQNAAKIVMIESAIPGENNILPPGTVPNIVLDHHSTSKDVSASDLVDIRSDVGALSTALTMYLQDLDVELDSKLATALLYGLRVDTKSFTRNVSPTDLKAAAYLSPFADQDMLKRIESPPMTSDTLDVIGRAIVNRELREGVLFSAVGYIEERDALPQAVEFLMRERDVRVAGLCGIRGYNIHISARSVDPTVHIGEVVKNAFGELGSGGGHATSGGVQIPLDRVNIPDKSDKELVVNVVSNMIRKLFFTCLGVDISTKTV